MKTLIILSTLAFSFTALSSEFTYSRSVEAVGTSCNQALEHLKEKMQLIEDNVKKTDGRVKSKEITIQKNGDLCFFDQYDNVTAKGFVKYY